MKVIESLIVWQEKESNKILWFKIFLFTWMSFFISGNSGLLNAKDMSNSSLKPFRVVLIIGDQWDDPSGYLINNPGPTGQYSGYDARPDVNGPHDFHDLTVMLKSWGIPFDIIRLDQVLLDRYMFLDMNDNPRYGTIIWDVNKSSRLLQEDYSVITEMVSAYGISLIGISDRIAQPEIQQLLGIKYLGSWVSDDDMTVVVNHFISLGIDSPFRVEPGPEQHAKREQVELSGNTISIINQGPFPQVTVKDHTSGARAVWIGNDYNYMFSSVSLRKILRRAITWTIGYSLYKTWEDDVIMIMDDPGGAQNAWLKSWHYAPLSDQVIEEYLIKPLQSHQAVLNINFVPAFVNDAKKRLEPTWNQRFTDEFGLEYDNILSKKAWDKGVRLGVFEVMCHGLTHMQPDLASDPVWYGTDLEKERSEVGWYREFGDTRRGGEIPAAEQLWRMKTGKEWLESQFGEIPLEFCPGGLGTSISYSNNTAKLAAQAGFGWCGWATGYLGKDLVITDWKFFGSEESPLFVPALPDAHDFGVTREPEKFAETFNQYPGKRFISINEFIGYLHSNITGNWSQDEKKLKFTLVYDQDYCRDFNEHATTWRLEFSDWLIKEVGEKYTIKTDGKEISPRMEEIVIPKGVGNHNVEISF